MSDLVCMQPCSKWGFDPHDCINHGCQLFSHHHHKEHQMLGEAQAKTSDINRMKQGNGGPSATLTEAVRRTSLPLDDLSKNIAHATDRVRTATNYTREVADALFGPQSQVDSESPGQPPAMGKLTGLSDQMGYHHSALLELEQQLNRFEPLRG